MCVTITPISSMWPANMRRGRSPPLRLAKQFPATSASTESANFSASARQIRPGAASNDEGPGVSSSVFRKAIDSGVTEYRAQEQFEEQCGLYRVGPVGWYFGEPELPVQADGCFHARESIEAHPLVSGPPAFLDDPLYQQATHSDSPKCRADIQSLHLANPRLQRTQCDTAGDRVIVECEQEAAGRRSVITRQRGQLLLKALKTEIHANGGGVFLKEGSRLEHAFSGRPVYDRQHTAAGFHRSIPGIACPANTDHICSAPSTTRGPAREV